MDKSYCPWTLSWNVFHNEQELPRKGSSGRKLVPANSGGHFTDAELKVVVRSATGTLLAHRGDHYHGTTQRFGSEDAGFTLGFSQRVYNAFQIAQQGIKIEVGNGTADTEAF